MSTWPEPPICPKCADREIKQVRRQVETGLIDVYPEIPPQRLREIVDDAIVRLRLEARRRWPMGGKQ